MGTLDEVAERFCPECGYDLRGLDGGRCPECGVEVLGEYVSPIPWEHRGTIGGWRAFWRTVGMVTFRAGKVARAAGEPVDLGAARLFRGIVTGMAAVSAVWLFLLFVGLDEGILPADWRYGVSRRIMVEMGWRGIGRWSELKLIWAAGAGRGWVAVIGLMIAVGVACRWPAVCFGEGRLDAVRRERLRVLGGYAIAPLAWMPLVALLWQARVTWSRSYREWTLVETWFLTVLTGVAVGAGVGTLLAAWLAPVRIRARAAREGLGGVMLTAVVGAPGGVVVGGVVGLILFPGVVGLVLIAVGSVGQ